jgi:hypothetical protein
MFALICRTAASSNKPLVPTAHPLTRVGTRAGGAAAVLGRRRKEFSVSVRYCIDPQSGAPHIYGHDVSEPEAE